MPQFQPLLEEQRCFLPCISVLLERESFLVTKADVLSGYSHEGWITCLCHKSKRDRKIRIWNFQSPEGEVGFASRQVRGCHGYWTGNQQCLPLNLGCLRTSTEGTLVLRGQSRTRCKWQFYPQGKAVSNASLSGAQWARWCPTDFAESSSWRDHSFTVQYRNNYPHVAL